MLQNLDKNGVAIQGYDQSRFFSAKQTYVEAAFVAAL